MNSVPSPGWLSTRMSPLWAFDFGFVFQFIQSDIDGLIQQWFEDEILHLVLVDMGKILEIGNDFSDTLHGFAGVFEQFPDIGTDG